MRASRIVAAATGVLIGVAGVAPAVNAQPPAAVSASAVANNGQGWGADDARKKFWADLREARQEFREDVREARQEFRAELRKTRQEAMAKHFAARQVLREAIQAARDAFLAAVTQANDAHGTTIAASRDTLLAVLQDPAATAEQRRAAVMTYRGEAQQAREAHRAAIKDAIADFKAARKAAWETFRAAIGK